MKETERVPEELVDFMPYDDGGISLEDLLEILISIG